MTEVKRKLAAILAADAAGYSRLMGADEAETVTALDASRSVFRERIEAHAGHVVDTAGDSVLATFDSVVEAVQCAVEVQTALAERNAELEEDRRMRFRIGINLGDVIMKVDGTVYGDGVNIAARLESLAEPGQITVSEDAYRQVDGKIDLDFEDIGSHNVKNIARPVRAYRICHGKSEPDPAPSLPEKPSIAVLPFANLSADPEQEYFADGIAEDVITELSRVDGLFVIARNSSFQFKGQAVDVSEVGRQFGVRFIVEGSVRRAGDRVRITSQLIDAVSGGHLWAERYDRQLTDVFAVQDDVTGQIVAALRAELGSSVGVAAHRQVTDNIEAYDLYLRGRAYMDRTTQSNNARAREMFEQAIALDPNMAAAHAELGLVRMRDWYYGWDTSPGVLEAARSAADAAVTCDERLPAAYGRLGWIQAWQGYHDEATVSSRRAVELDANYADGYSMLAAVLTFNGLTDEALTAARHAARLDPHSFLPAFHQAIAHFAAERYPDAIAAARECLRGNPSFPAAHQVLVASQALLGRDAEARAGADELRRLAPTDRGHVYDVPFRDRSVLDRWSGGLRAAGLDVPGESDLA